VTEQQDSLKQPCPETNSNIVVTEHPKDSSSTVIDPSIRQTVIPASPKFH
jgi:hypothetical protein